MSKCNPQAAEEVELFEQWLTGTAAAAETGQCDDSS